MLCGGDEKIKVRNKKIVLRPMAGVCIEARFIELNNALLGCDASSPSRLSRPDCVSSHDLPVVWRAVHGRVCVRLFASWVGACFRLAQKCACEGCWNSRRTHARLSCRGEEAK